MEQRREQPGHGEHQAAGAAESAQAEVSLLDEPDIRKFIKRRNIKEAHWPLLEELAEYPAHPFHVLHNFLAGQVKFDKEAALAEVRSVAELSEQQESSGRPQEIPPRIYRILEQIVDAYGGDTAWALIREMEEVLPLRERRRRETN